MAEATLKDVIERLKAEGLNTRNRGTNSLKSVKEVLNVQLGQLNSSFVKFSEMIKEQNKAAAAKAALEEPTKTDGKVGKQDDAVGKGTYKAAKGVGGLGGALGGLMGLLAGPGLMLLGGGMTALAAGFTALGVAAPAIVASGVALGTFIAAIGAGTWIFGKGAQEFGQGLEDISEGLKTLDETGKNINFDNLERSGEALQRFLTTVGGGGLKGLLGAVTTFFTGDLPKIADGLNELNNINVDEQKVISAGRAAKGFITAMGEGSLWESFKGIVTTAISPSVDTMKDVADGLVTIGKAEIDMAKIKSAAEAMKILQKPLYDISTSGITANFVGKNAMIDISDGISYLNKTEVSNAQKLADAFTILDKPVFGLITGGLVANFVGKNALTDLADGVAYMIKTAGTDTAIEGAKKAATALDAMRGSLMSFSGSQLIGSLANAGSAILNFLSGEKSPTQQMLTLADRAKDLTSAATALNDIGKAMSSFGNIKIKKESADFETLAKNISASLPILQGLSQGGFPKTGSGVIKMPGWFSGNIDVPPGGIFDPKLRLDDLVPAMQKVNAALTGTAVPTATAANTVPGGTSGTGGGTTNVTDASTNVANGAPVTNNYVTNNYYNTTSRPRVSAGAAGQ